MKQSFLNKALRIMLSTDSLVLLAGAMFGPIYALFVKDIGGDLMDASIAWGIFTLVAGTTALLSGKYSDKIKENELVVVFGYTVMGAGFLLFTRVDSIIALFLIQALIGFGEGIYAPAFNATYSKHLDNHKAGRQWGAWESINYFTAAIGAIIGGVVITQFGFNILFIIMAIFCFISALYIYKLPREVL